MTHKQFEDYLSLPGVLAWLSVWRDVAVYKFGRDNIWRGKMVALVRKVQSRSGSKPKIRSVVEQNLQEKYETVLPGYHLNKHWNTIICSGQIDWRKRSWWRGWAIGEVSGNNLYLIWLICASGYSLNRQQFLPAFSSFDGSLYTPSYWLYLLFAHLSRETSCNINCTCSRRG